MWLTRSLWFLTDNILSKIEADIGNNLQNNTTSNKTTHKQSPPSVGPTVVALDDHEALLGQALGSEVSCHGPVILHALHVRATIDLLKVENWGS